MEPEPSRRRNGIVLAVVATALLLVSIALGNGGMTLVGGAALAGGLLLGAAAVANAWSRSLRGASEGPDAASR
jgi:hypothetical protein